MQKIAPTPIPQIVLNSIFVRNSYVCGTPCCTLQPSLEQSICSSCSPPTSNTIPNPNPNPTAGIPQTEPLLKLLPSKAEADFGLGWANLVDFVAAMQYDVDYNQTNTMQGLVVPPRMLTDADKPPHIKDFTGAEMLLFFPLFLFIGFF